MQLSKPVLFVLAVLAVGLFIGYANVPGGWHAKLTKPWFNPPNWIFARRQRQAAALVAAMASA